MSSDVKNKVITAINSALGENLDEAYVTEPKKFDLRTELLSSKSKQARQKDFEEFVESLNTISAQLDGADSPYTTLFQNSDNTTTEGEFRYLSI